VLLLALLFNFATLPLHAQTANTTVADDTHLITNAGFETGNLEGWKHWSTKYAEITNDHTPENMPLNWSGKGFLQASNQSEIQ
jgi:hypothetical protein